MSTESLNEQLVMAAAQGDSHAVSDLLSKNADPNYRSSYALVYACVLGHIDCVKLLLPVTDPASNENEAIRNASEEGHANIVQLLLPYYNFDDDGFLLSLANTEAVIDVLYPLSNVEGALEIIRAKGKTNSLIEHHWKAEQEKNEIQQALPSASAQKNGRKL